MEQIRAQGIDCNGKEWIVCCCCLGDVGALAVGHRRPPQLPLGCTKGNQQTRPSQNNCTLRHLMQNCMINHIVECTKGEKLDNTSKF